MIHSYEKLEDVPTPPPDGTYAVVDVLRFSTTACTIFEQGARVIHPVRSEEEAFELQSNRDDILLAGEHNATRIEGFDTGNSPATLATMDLTNRELVCLTSNGTRALNKLSGRKVIVGSLTNAKSAAAFLHRQDTVHLVACGSSGASSPEDLAGIHLLKRYLDQETVTDEQKQALREEVRAAPHAKRLEEHGFQEDVDVAVDINRHDVVPQQESGQVRPTRLNET